MYGLLFEQFLAVALATMADGLIDSSSIKSIIQYIKPRELNVLPEVTNLLHTF